MESWMQTTVEGEGTVTFEWSVWSEEGDYLQFYIDGQFKCQIDGEQDWQEKEYPVTGQGTHTLKWRFVTSEESGGGGCGYVDNMQWSGSPEPVPDPAKWDTTTYKYDPSGRRIEKSGNGEAIKYSYDGGHVLAEYDGDDRLLRKYIYGARVDEPVCMIEVVDSNAVYYYHFDGLGSVVAPSDSSGDSCQSYEYSAYGQVAAEDPDHPNPYMFTGRRFDIETGLYYYRARCYNPHIGRFMQTDPVGYSAGINWYLYCRNNPLGFVDPSALDWEDPDLNIVLYDGSEKRDDGTSFFDEAVDDDHWDVKIDIGGMELGELLNCLAGLKGHIMAQMKAAGKEYKWEEITIEGLRIFDHGNDYGDTTARRGTDNFNKIWGAMGKALDENRGTGAIIHHRGCDMATDYGTGSAITDAAVVSGHSVTGSVGPVRWYATEQEGIPDYYSPVGYKIATPVGRPGSGNYTVSDYYGEFTTWFTNPATGDMIHYTWTSNKIAW